MSKELKDELPKEKALLTVEAEVTIDPAYSRGNMHFTVQDCSASVKEGDKKIGEIWGCLGGGVEIKEVSSGKTYFISAKSLWEAFKNRTVKEE